MHKETGHKTPCNLHIKHHMKHAKEFPVRIPGSKHHENIVFFAVVIQVMMVVQVSWAMMVMHISWVMMVMQVSWEMVVMQVT